MASSEFYLVRADVLPEVYTKVVEVRRLLDSGDALTIGEACRAVDISRSAYYKYKDSVLPFYDMVAGKIVTFHGLLEDSPGVLSRILEVFAGSGANILTINQSIPVDGNAQLAIAADTSEMLWSLEDMITAAAQLPGVVKFEILASGR